MGMIGVLTFFFKSIIEFTVYTVIVTGYAYIHQMVLDWNM